jgi:protein tyrosine phosphatase
MTKTFHNLYQHKKGGFVILMFILQKKQGRYKWSKYRKVKALSDPASIQFSGSMSMVLFPQQPEISEENLFDLPKVAFLSNRSPH